MRQNCTGSMLAIIRRRGGIDTRGRPERPAGRIEVGKVGPQVELQLRIIGLHVSAQLIESLVVLAFLDVGQFVHNDHAQEFRRHLLEHRRDANLALGLEISALYSRDAGVRAQRVLDDVQLVVERHLAQLSGVAKVLAFEFQHVVVKRLVGAYLVCQRILLQQQAGQPILRDQLLHLLDQCHRVTGKVIRRWFRAHG